jgi:nucleotide-binding universal stress UspA family protein
MEREQKKGEPMLPPKVIVSPIDFSNHSQEALQTAADLAKQFGSQLLLVHAVPAITKLPSATSIFHEAEYEQELHKDAGQRLQKLAGEFAAKGLQVRTEVGIANDVGMEILRIAEHNSADLIVIATHGMTGWHRLAFGSVTEKVVRLASCPVLVLRANPKAGQDAPSKSAGAVAAVSG